MPNEVNVNKKVGNTVKTEEQTKLERRKKIRSWATMLLTTAFAFTLNAAAPSIFLSAVASVVTPVAGLLFLGGATATVVRAAPIVVKGIGKVFSKIFSRNKNKNKDRNKNKDKNKNKNQEKELNKINKKLNKLEKDIKRLEELQKKLARANARQQKKLQKEIDELNKKIDSMKNEFDDKLGKLGKNLSEELQDLYNKINDRFGNLNIVINNMQLGVENPTEGKDEVTQEEKDKNIEKIHIELDAMTEKYTKSLCDNLNNTQLKYYIDQLEEAQKNAKDPAKKAAYSKLLDKAYETREVKKQATKTGNFYYKDFDTGIKQESREEAIRRVEEAKKTADEIAKKTKSSGR